MKFNERTLHLTYICIYIKFHKLIFNKFVWFMNYLKDLINIYIIIIIKNII